MPSMNNFAKSLAIFTLPALIAGCSGLQKSKVSVDYYSISGNTTAALDSEIKRKGPRLDGGRHAVAVARIRIIPNVTFNDRGSKCRITKAKVPVDAKVTLPRWTGRKTASKKLGAAWDNIDRYTRLHEAMHVTLAFQHAKKIEVRLLKLKPMNTCLELKRSAKLLVDKLLVEHDRVQKKFDTDEQKRFSILSKRSRTSKKTS